MINTLLKTNSDETIVHVYQKIVAFENTHKKRYSNQKCHFKNKLIKNDNSLVFGSSLQ